MNAFHKVHKRNCSGFQPGLRRLQQRVQRHGGDERTVEWGRRIQGHAGRIPAQYAVSFSYIIVFSLKMNYLEPVYSCCC